MTSARVEPSPEGVAGAVVDPASMSAEELTFPGSGATPVNGYLAHPATAGAHPGMIVIHEAGGLNDHVRAVAVQNGFIGAHSRRAQQLLRTPSDGDDARVTDRFGEAHEHHADRSKSNNCHGISGLPAALFQAAHHACQRIH